MEIKYISENALICIFEAVIDETINHQVLALKKAIEEAHIEGIEELVTSYHTLVVYLDETANHDVIAEQIKKLKISKSSKGGKKVFYIPVCYDYGLDLEELAAHCQLSAQEVIERHTAKQYLIYMLGFMPGFPFLGGLDPSIAKPRKETPRKEIPAGSVGIANEQTGMYPFASPGGWNIIGRTPVKLFDAERTPSVYYEAGNYIQFKAISKEEYAAIEQDSHYKVEVEEVTQ
ncbi:5-oxoprolinase subunit PxpB [Macrococcus hajekii]|uniref:5-oxoprolinase subunit PxpB n=1 Tax=Macrococcus hajekii TaxID=198482 RepID=A0A4R6BHT9_9STAP|nr:5-oxoprolinase subunit PxpB [Macrococcus hajekii]TDM01088.1 5-oxoprolinase subunit PxpB [Macrococcus hajekii]GGB12504.1 allophanate hydrolase [Macrococcus hajekii]